MERGLSGSLGPLHRRGRNPECLEDEDIERYHDYDGEDDGVEPVQPHIALLPLLVVLLPECPLYLSGDEYVENHCEAQKPPIIAEPYHPKEIEQTPESEFEPLILQELSHLRLLTHLRLLSLYRVDDCLECLGIIESQVCQYLAVQPYVLLCESADELRVVHTVLTGSCVDTLNPKRAEIAFLLFTVVLPCEEVTAGLFENFLTACS